MTLEYTTVVREPPTAILTLPYKSRISFKGTVVICKVTFNNNHSVILFKYLTDTYRYGKPNLKGDKPHKICQ